MVIPLLEGIDIAGKTLTADALLTQRRLAQYLLDRRAHYLFTVKANQPTLLADLHTAFEQPGPAHFQEPPTLAHGRIETRCIWVTTALNDYLDFPGVGQAWRIDRHVIEKKTGHAYTETVYGITSHHPNTATPKQLLTINRGHWTIENSCHYILDWNWDEDRCTVRSGYGPENLSRLRRFAIGLIKSFSPHRSVASTIDRLHRNVRLVFDLLGITRNARRPRPLPPKPAG
jgi:predicted transposase YbfD/YdcC